MPVDIFHNARCGALFAAWKTNSSVMVWGYRPQKMPAIALVIESSHYVHIAYKKQKKLEDTAIKE